MGFLAMLFGHETASGTTLSTPPEIRVFAAPSGALPARRRPLLDCSPTVVISGGVRVECVRVECARVEGGRVRSGRVRSLKLMADG